MSSAVRRIIFCFLMIKMIGTESFYAHLADQLFDNNVVLDNPSSKTSDKDNGVSDEIFSALRNKFLSTYKYLFEESRPILISERDYIHPRGMSHSYF